MRVPRSPAALLAAVAAVAAAVVLPAAPAAAGSLDLSVVCDPVTRTVSTAASGVAQTYDPTGGLTVEFRMIGGSYADPGASGSLPPLPPVSVRVTAGPDRAWSATGYTRAWAARGELFYYERVRLRVLNAAGVEVSRTEGSCHHDGRTTVTFGCDPATGTVDVRAAGARYDRHRSVTVRYYVLRTWSQATADSPVFVGQSLGEPLSQRTVTVPVAADGTWSDPGVQRTTSGTAYYAAAEYLVVVSTPGEFNVYQLGRGQGLCVSANRRPA
jgi:hypothetical protein